ncbi:hypothetical protein Q5P01_011324 [Channa striata]|uniref:INO80 complex subunit F domain-containing protein n=1 Tax=Channa striata TaxID=64152 RepID=A0AA88MT73_CHASR|nr:hypothetical protein Q5P01_011324 [Channa striata]
MKNLFTFALSHLAHASIEINKIEEKAHRRWIKNMMEDFSGLALPPLFGGHILEAELEPGGVELGPGEVELDPGSNKLLESTTQDDEERRALDKRKYLSLSRRCKEIEQVNQKILGRLHQVQRITRRLKKERRFLMKTLDAHGDDYRNAHLTILLEEEPAAHLDPPAVLEDDRLNDKDKDPQTEQDMMADTHFGEIPSPTPYPS